MGKALHTCSEPGCPQLVREGKCRNHFTGSPTYQARNHSSADRKLRSQVVSDWVAVNGYICPGYQRPPHASTDLTAAHGLAVAYGGTSDDLSVLCRSCNSRQGVNGGEVAPEV